MYQWTGWPLVQVMIVPCSVPSLSIGSDNGSLPIWRQAFIWINAGLFSINKDHAQKSMVSLNL